MFKSSSGLAHGLLCLSLSLNPLLLKLQDFPFLICCYNEDTEVPYAATGGNQTNKLTAQCGHLGLIIKHQKLPFPLAHLTQPDVTILMNSADLECCFFA